MNFTRFNAKNYCSFNKSFLKEYNNILTKLLALKSQLIMLKILNVKIIKVTNIAIYF